MKNSSLLGLSRRERELISYFSANEKITINSDDVIKIRHCSRSTVNQILSRLAQKGWLQRVRHGVYSIVPLSSITTTPIIEEVWPLAVNLFEPAYISGWSAAEHWDLTEQIFNSLSLVTQKPQRKSVQIINGIKFRVRVLKKKYFFGTKTLWFGSNQVEVADPSKLIIDIMDMPDFGGGGRHSIDIVKAYWNSELNNPEQILEYAIKYRRGTVMKRLGFLSEKFNAPVSKKWLQKCRSYQSAGISNLDPNSPGRGKISSKWNLRINIPL
ncbi:MAG TPA: hypothetical protein ENI57_10425 [Ignavibacteria bacterium]|nr:hypothetical protein [Ignavibacteria bacterium]